MIDLDNYANGLSTNIIDSMFAGMPDYHRTATRQYYRRDRKRGNSREFARYQAANYIIAVARHGH